MGLTMTVVNADRLRDFATTVLTRVGVPADQAADAANVLLWANLHGVDTHGVRNLKPFYVDRILSGRVNPKPNFHMEYETPLTGRANADSGLGLAAGCWAMRQAIAKAKDHGIGLISIRHSNHFGAAGYFAMQAVPHDMIGVALTGFMSPKGMESGVLPANGKRPMLSTNPISFAAPTRSADPFLLDMATSISPMNRVWLYKELGKVLPLGWGLDGDSQPTTDPAALRALFPLGGSLLTGGHKGYGLALVVEILCAQLSGGFGPSEEAGEEGSDEGYTQRGDAHFFAAIRVDMFRPVDEFKESMDAMIDALHQAEPMGDEKVIVPGEPQHATRRARQESGVPLAPNVVEDLTTLSQTYNVPLPWD